MYEVHYARDPDVVQWTLLGFLSAYSVFSFLFPSTQLAPSFLHLLENLELSRARISRLHSIICIYSVSGLQIFQWAFLSSMFFFSNLTWTWTEIIKQSCHRSFKSDPFSPHPPLYHISVLLLHQPPNCLPCVYISSVPTYPPMSTWGILAKAQSFAP